MQKQGRQDVDFSKHQSYNSNMSKLERFAQIGVLAALPLTSHAFIDGSPSNNNICNSEDSSHVLQLQNDTPVFLTQENKNQGPLEDYQKYLLEAGIIISDIGYLGVTWSNRRVAMTPAEPAEKKVSEAGFWTLAAGLTSVAIAAVTVVQSKL